jgi:succinate dehydrogenase hydrophobic anchor subunit
MNEIMKDITGVVMAVVGVAILAVLVSKNNNTSGVISSAAQGFTGILATAMGGTSGVSNPASF